MAGKGNTKPATVYTNPNSPTPAARRAARTAAQKEAAGADLEAQLKASLEAGKPAKVDSPAPKVDKGKQAVQVHRELRDFAKDYGQKNPTIDRIYIKLDESGRPMEVISQGQAGALTRKKLPWTWVNNVWGSPKNLHTGGN